MSHILKSCPFCGSTTVMLLCSEDSASFWVACKSCEVEGPIAEAGDGENFEKEAKEKAVRKWNRRPRATKTVKKLKTSVAWEQ